MRLTEITHKLKRDAGNATHFVVFDACRNTLKLTQPGSRAVVQSKGFVPVAQENGMLIAYATAEGELASDFGAGAGPYARVLAEEIVKPGIEAVIMFRAVQRRVRTAIHQEPYLGFNALGDVYLAGRSEQPAAVPVTQQKLSQAAEAWTIVKDTTSIAALEAFMARFKGAYYADLAQLRIEELTKQQVAVATPPVQSNGEIGKVDDREGARRYKLAAEQGDGVAQTNLGFLYETGRGGLAKDDRETARLYKLAADQGLAVAQNNLGVLYRDGRGGLPQNDQEAARLFKLAADQGLAKAQASLGAFYANGRGGLAKDDREAARLYKLAADQGHAWARDRLSLIFNYNQR